jgi:lipoyl(octanoyl) transferase
MTDGPGNEIDGVEWRVEPGLTDYATALAFMQARVDEIRAGTATERIWLVEHPPVYTAGTSAKADDLIDPARFPVHVAGRGGQYTYHGPGQRVVYVMLDLERRGRDVRCFVTQLERWIIRVLAQFDVAAKVAPGRVGVWVDTPRGEEKVAAIGVRVRRWVTLHGAAINVDPDLTHFGGIVPCGIADHGVTSLRALGQNTTTGDVDAALEAEFPRFLAALVS